MCSRHVVFGLLSVFVLGLCECTAKVGVVGGQSSTTTARVVNLAIWSNYVSPELLGEFEKKTGIKVQISNYSSNEELLAKLQAGATGYDVAVPSDYMVFAMSKLGLVRPLDYSLLPNAKALDSRFLNKPFDSDNRVSVPYDWGTTGIAVNRDLYKGEIKGWRNLFGNKDLAGRFTLLDDVRETIGSALKMSGLSLNTRNPDELKLAKELLFKVRKAVKGFTSEPMMSLVAGETAVAHAYMSDTLQARAKSGGKNIEYVIPEEGSTLWIDNLVIPSGGANVREAHELVNFLLEARSGRQTVMSVFVAPANRDVFGLLPKEFQENKALFPPPAVLARAEMMQDLGDASLLWDRVWTEVKAGL